MRFKPGTTNAEAKAKLAAFAEKQRTRNAGPVNKPPVLPPRPSTPMTQRPVQPPPSQINPGKPNVMGFPDEQPTQQQMQQQAGMGRPSGSMNLGTAAGPGGGRLPIGVGPSMPVTQQQMQTMAQEEMQRMGLFGRPGGMPPRPGNYVPPQQINPFKPNVMGFPDPGIADERGFVKPPDNEMQARQDALRQREMVRPGGPVNMGGLGQGGSSVNTTTQSDIMGRPRPNSGGFNPANMQQGLQSLAAQNNPQAVAKPAFKKGGKVSAKAPVKKAAGGKVAAKAPVKKAMGGKVAAKPMSRPVAKAKPMARPMPAMKRGGKVMMKGKYK